MQGYSTKKKNEPRPSEHPPVVGGGNKHRIHGKLGIQLSFRVCYITSIDVDVILDTCSTIEIIICYHK